MSHTGGIKTIKTTVYSRPEGQSPINKQVPEVAISAVTEPCLPMSASTWGPRHRLVHLSSELNRGVEGRWEGRKRGTFPRGRNTFVMLGKM